MKIKVFIPSYNRPKDITTHKIFLTRKDLFDVKVVVRDYQYQEYLELVDKDNLIGVKGIENLNDTRQWIYDNNQLGEWFISADDDIDGIYINKKSFDKTFSDDYKYEIDNDFFFSKIEEILNYANYLNVFTVGFSLVKNEFFNKKKYTTVGHIANGIVFWKRQENINWKSNGFLDSMEEMNITAQHHMYNGKVLRCHYIKANAKMYQDGGIGNYIERKPKKVIEVKKLMDYYTGFFRPKNDDDVSVAFTNTTQVKKWRLKMIVQGKLPKHYAYEILGEKQGQLFIDKYLNTL